jgi:hypothetical protein
MIIAPVAGGSSWIKGKWRTRTKEKDASAYRGDGECGQASDLDRAAQDFRFVSLAPLLISGNTRFVPISKLKKA